MQENNVHNYSNDEIHTSTSAATKLSKRFKLWDRDEARNTPLYREHSSVVLVQELHDFFEHIPDNLKFKTWQLLYKQIQIVKEGTYDNPRIPLFSKVKDSLRGKQIRAFRIDARRKKGIRKNLNHLKEESSLSQKLINNLIDKLVETPDSLQLLLSDRILIGLGINEQIEHGYDDDNKSAKEKLNDLYLESMDGYMPNMLFSYLRPDELGSIIVNQKTIGISSASVIRLNILESLQNNINPFEDMDDDLFYKTALLCKIHGLLDKNTVLSNILITFIRKRAEKLTTQTPKFVEILPEQTINTKDPLLELLKKTSTTILSGTLSSRNQHIASNDAMLVSGKRIGRKGNSNVLSDLEASDLAKSKNSNDGAQAYQNRIGYRKHLKEISAHLNPKTSDNGNNFAVLERIIKKNHNIIGSIQSILNQSVAESKSDTKNHPISDRFIQSIKEKEPNFYQEIEKYINTDNPIITTAYIYLIIQEVSLSHESRQDRQSTINFNYFVESELLPFQRTSINFLNEDQTIALKEEIDDLDLSFDTKDDEHLDSNSGVVLLSNDELDELNDELVFYIDNSFLPNKIELKKSLNMRLMMISELIFLIITASTFITNQIIDISPEELTNAEKNMQILLYSLISGVGYFSIKLIANDIIKRIKLNTNSQPFKSKISNNIYNHEQISKEYLKNFSSTLVRMTLLTLSLYTSQHAYDQNRDAINDFFENAYESLVDRFEKSGIGQRMPDIMLGNTIPERPGKPEYRIFPQNFTGYVMNGDFISLNKYGVLKKIDEDTPEYKNVFEKDERIQHTLIETYQINDDIFTISQKENIPLKTETDNPPDYLIMEKLRNDDEFYNIVGYMPHKVYISERDGNNIKDKPAYYPNFSWSPLSSITTEYDYQDPVYVIYRKIGLLDKEHFQQYMSKDNRPYNNYSYMITDDDFDNSNESIYDDTSGFPFEDKSYLDRETIYMGRIINNDMETINNKTAEELRNQGFDIKDGEFDDYLYANNEFLFDKENWNTDAPPFPNILITITYNGKRHRIFLPYNFQNNPNILDRIAAVMEDNGNEKIKSDFQEITESLSKIILIPNQDSTSLMMLIRPDTLAHLEQLNSEITPTKTSSISFMMIYSPYIQNQEIKPLSHLFERNLLNDDALAEVDSSLDNRNVIAPIATVFDQEKSNYDHQAITEVLYAIFEDEELEYLFEISQYIENNANEFANDLEKLKYIQQELEKRGLNYEGGNQKSFGDLEAILEMLRIDLKTNKLQNPDQVCNGMAAEIYVIARLADIEVTLMTVNVKQPHTSYAGNSSNGHMVVAYKQNHIWSVFEATLPDYANDTRIPQLPSENLELLEAMREASSKSKEIALLLFTIMGASGIAKGLYHLDKNRKNKNDDNESEIEKIINVIPSKKLTKLLKDLDSTEINLLSRVLMHVSQNGDIQTFWEKDQKIENPIYLEQPTNQNNEQIDIYSIKRIVGESIEDVVISSIWELEEIENPIADISARSNLTSNVVPKACFMLETSRQLPWKKRTKLIINFPRPYGRGFSRFKL